MTRWSITSRDLILSFYWQCYALKYSCSLQLSVTQMNILEISDDKIYKNTVIWVSLIIKLKNTIHCIWSKWLVVMTVLTRAFAIPDSLGSSYVLSKQCSCLLWARSSRLLVIFTMPGMWHIYKWKQLWMVKCQQYYIRSFKQRCK